MMLVALNSRSTAECRAGCQGLSMGSVYRDFLYGLKSFSRNPLFASVFVAALAVGIGAAISVFTVVDALVLRPLPVPHPEQLVGLTGNYRAHSRIDRKSVV